MSAEHFATLRGELRGAERSAWGLLRRASAGFLAMSALAASLVLGGVAAAHAHVSVESSGNEGGTWVVLTFRAPTESDTASTTGVRVQLPQDAPFTSVRVKPIAGWSAELVRADDAAQTVTEVVWTADGEGLQPGEFGEFEVAAGPLPAEGTVYFPTVQSYSDGTEVDWVQQAEAGSEPDYPAPSLVVAPSANAADDDGHSIGGPEVAVATPTVQPNEPQTDWPFILSAAALVVSLIAATAAIAPLLRRTR